MNRGSEERYKVKLGEFKEMLRNVCFNYYAIEDMLDELIKITYQDGKNSK